MVGQAEMPQPHRPGVPLPRRALHESCTGGTASASVLLRGCFVQPEVDFSMKGRHVTLERLKKTTIPQVGTRTRCFSLPVSSPVCRQQLGSSLPGRLGHVGQRGEGCAPHGMVTAYSNNKMLK